MRLGTLKTGGRDGTLVVIRSDGGSFAKVPEIAPTLQTALDRWPEVSTRLEEVAARLECGTFEGEPLDERALCAPLPRAYEWVDASAYINHIELVRRARGVAVPEFLRTDPLVYQGGSGTLLGPRDPIPLIEEDFGLDFEGELCVVLGDTPQGTKASEASEHILLVMMCNDVSLRNVIASELKKGFGFFQGKPSTAYSPWAVRPADLEGLMVGGRLHSKMLVELNGTRIGELDSGPEMHFSFLELIEHLCRTRSFTAGTILGSGTVSNKEPSRGVACLAERRMREVLESGQAETPFLREGDEVRIECVDGLGRTLFGSIDQRVCRTHRSAASQDRFT
ncbi:MAG: fumarylacetoacetate hydrolase family protein [Myxococcota bacterium]